MADSNTSVYQPSAADRDLAIRTMLGEASNQGDDGMAAVAHVIMNRVKGGVGGNTPSDVVLAHGQFEPWSTRANELANIDPKSAGYQRAGQIFDAVSSGIVPDFTNGATHFYSPAAQAKFGRNPPNWDDGSGQKIGGHLFFAPDGRVSYAGQSGIAGAVDKIAPQPASQAQMSNNTSRTDDDFYREIGVDPSAVKSGGDQKQPAASASGARDMAQFYSDLGVDRGAVESPPQSLGIDAQTGLAATKDANGIVTLSDPKTGQAKQSFAPGDYERWTAREGGASQMGSFAQGALNGIPIAGPSVVSGVEKLAAAAQSARSGAPYDQALANVQQQANLDRSVYPTTNAVGEGAGATASYVGAGGVPVAARALGMAGGSLAGQIAAGAASNALIGGADAYARGENPVTGAISGGVSGAAAPALGKIIGSAGSGIVNHLNAVAPTGVPGVDRPAANMLATLLDADNPHDVQSMAARLGPLATLADTGPSLQAITGGLASRPGEASAIINRNLFARQQGATNRLAADITDAVGPAEDPITATRNILARRSALDAAYSDIHANAPPVDVSGVVAKIDAQLPTATGAQKSALQNIRSELVSTPEQIGPDGRTIPETYQTSSELLHNLRKDIDSAVNYGTPGLGVPQAALTKSNGAIKGIRGSIDDALKSQVPGMAEADAASAALAKRAEAVETGANEVLKGGQGAIWPKTFAQDYAKMSPGEQIAMNKGIRGDIDRRVGTNKNDLVALTNALQGDGGWNAQKIGTAFGDDASNALVNAANREARFAGTYGEILKNSATQRRAAAQAMLDDADPRQTNFLPASPTGLVLQGAKSFVVNPIMDALMKIDSSARDAQLAKALTASGPARDQIINSLLPLIARSQATSRAAGAADQYGGALTNALMRAAGLEWAKPRSASR